MIEYVFPLAPMAAARLLLAHLRSTAFNPDQPRDEHGQWATTPSGIMGALQQSDGGFTYHVITGTTPTSGFALSLHKDREQVFDAKDVTLVTLAQYAKANQDLLSQSENYLGGWHNPQDGKIYLDVSTVVQHASEAERLGREAHQLAYFDLAHGQSVSVEQGHVKAAANTRGVTERSTITRRFNRDGSTTDRERPDAGRNRAGAQDLRGLAFDESQHPRDEKGQFSLNYAHVYSEQLPLTDAEAGAVDYYISTEGAHALNMALRTGTPLTLRDTPYVVKLDDAIAKGLITKDVTLWRGLRATGGGALANLPIGTVFQDKGFVSLTDQKLTAAYFSTSKGVSPESTLAEIRVPKGTHALDMVRSSPESGEGEWLLGRDTQFRLVERHDGFPRRVTLEVVR